MYEYILCPSVKPSIRCVSMNGGMNECPHQYIIHAVR